MKKLILCLSALFISVAAFSQQAGVQETPEMRAKVSAAGYKKKVSNLSKEQYNTIYNAFLERWTKDDLDRKARLYTAEERAERRKVTKKKCFDIVNATLTEEQQQMIRDYDANEKAAAQAKAAAKQAKEEEKMFKKNKGK